MAWRPPVQPGTRSRSGCRVLALLRFQGICGRETPAFPPGDHVYRIGPDNEFFPPLFQDHWRKVHWEYSTVVRPELRAARRVPLVAQRSFSILLLAIRSSSRPFLSSPSPSSCVAHRRGVSFLSEQILFPPQTPGPLRKASICSRLRSAGVFTGCWKLSSSAAGRFLMVASSRRRRNSNSKLSQSTLAPKWRMRVLRS